MPVFGWDVSTSIVGFCALDESGCGQTFEYLDLRKVEGFMEKCELAKSFVSDRCLSGQEHYVEDRLGSFAFGKTSSQTLMKLASFNSVVSWLLHERGAVVSHIHPSRVKSVMRQDGLVIPPGGDKKNLTLAFVRSVCFGFPHQVNRKGNPQPWCFDMADAYIVGRAGFKQGCKDRKS
jgi:hypothetical protein